MKRRYVFVILLLTFYFFSTEQIFASRAFPAKIESIIYKDIRIVAKNNSPDNMGIIQAFNKNTNTLLWSKKIYKVKIDPNIEEDTQWVFIKEMKIEDNKLLIVNEQNKIYEVDPNTGKVLNDSNSIVIVVSLVVSITTLFIVVLYMYKRRKRML